MDSLIEINETLAEAERYQQMYPRDRGIRRDVGMLHARREMAMRPGEYWVARAAPENLQQMLVELNNYWQALMIRPRDMLVQEQVQLRTEELFRTIVTTQRVMDGEHFPEER